MKNTITSLISVFIVGLMVFVSQKLNNPEIIFPEISAIAVGSLLSPKMSWNVSKLRILACITLCAVCGVLLVRFLSVPVWGQMIVGYALAQLIFIFSKTTFAPMISAMVLPIMLQTTTPIYIISAVVFTLIILAFRFLLEQKNLLSLNHYKKIDSVNSYSFKVTLIRTLLVAPLIIISLIFNFKLAVAPPLLVAFTEFSNSNKSPKALFKATLLISATAFIGTASRYVLTICFGIPLFVSAVVAMLITVLLIRKTKLFIPPAGALTVLAMLIPQEILLLYPLQVFIGISVLSFLSKICSNFIFPLLIKNKKRFLV